LSSPTRLERMEKTWLVRRPWNICYGGVGPEGVRHEEVLAKKREKSHLSRGAFCPIKSIGGTGKKG